LDQHFLPSLSSSRICGPTTVLADCGSAVHRAVSRRRSISEVRSEVRFEVRSEAALRPATRVRLQQPCLGMRGPRNFRACIPVQCRSPRPLQPAHRLRHAPLRSSNFQILALRFKYGAGTGLAVIAGSTPRRQSGASSPNRSRQFSPHTGARGLIRFPRSLRVHQVLPRKTLGPFFFLDLLFLHGTVSNLARNILCVTPAPSNSPTPFAPRFSLRNCPARLKTVPVTLLIIKSGAARFVVMCSFRVKWIGNSRETSSYSGKLAAIVAGMTGAGRSDESLRSTTAQPVLHADYDQTLDLRGTWRSIRREAYRLRARGRVRKRRSRTGTSSWSRSLNRRVHPLSMGGRRG